MLEFKNRLVEFARKQYGMGQTRFEEKCGIHPGTISAIKSNGPTASVVTKISVSCPELNLNWLFTGEGAMLNNSQEKPVSSKMLPLIPSEAFAGPGEITYNDERVEDYYVISEFKNSDFLIQVKGDSMTPKYNGGDIVACKRVHDMLFLQWGRVYVIYTQSQGIMIKRVHPGEKEGYITLVSDNAKYAPFQVPISDISAIALVNGAVTLE